MMYIRCDTPTGIDTPATYRIWVGGCLAPAWSERLAGMSLRIRRRRDGAFITRLEGELLDQAALAGVINTLFELQLPLLAVKRLTTDCLSQ
jgi:hypothetical protein